ncbi:hypothetical protein ABZ897_42920 [Nonomuraea sp. NPDC046802]|uniref:hypothetical protein n=1 Tax=Nonomuraea sp. NPDC046802 TaxID=3154919 RepID=UPI0033DCE082
MVLSREFNHRPRLTDDLDLAPAGTCVVCGSLADPEDPTRHQGEQQPGQAPDPPRPPVPDRSSQPLLRHVESLLRAELADTPVPLTAQQLDTLACRAAFTLYHHGALKPLERWAIRTSD